MWRARGGGVRVASGGCVCARERIAVMFYAMKLTNAHLE
jgi:hypothetical protein